MDIHHCDWAGQPDIHISCDSSWTTPTWNESEKKDLPEEVYASDDKRRYTFEKAKVTCPACLLKIRENTK